MTGRGNHRINRVDVVAGVICNPAGYVLVNQRSSPPQFAGKWEFPGGKMEAGEDVEQSLYRELLEEVGIVTLSSEPLISISHDYPERSVHLQVRKVVMYEGVPTGNEGQCIRWVHPNQLHDMDFLPANEPILNALQLPHIYLITDTQRFGCDKTLHRLAALLSKRRSMVQVREKDMTLDQYRKFSGQIISLCHRYGCHALANADPDLALELGFDGVHLASEKIGAVEFPRESGFWIGASCHDTEQINLATSAGADFAVLSPVAKTRSHPDAVPLGWQGFSDICSVARIPIYALGGMDFSSEKPAREYGAQGVAMISAMWQ